MRLQMPLHPCGAFVVQHAGQHPAGQIADGDGGGAVIKPLGAFETDQPRADNQHAGIVLHRRLQRQCVVERHEGECLFDRLQALQRRQEGRGTGGDAERIVGQDCAVVQLHRLCRRVQTDRRFAVQHPTAVLFVKAGVAVLHALYVGLSL